MDYEQRIQKLESTISDLQRRLSTVLSENGVRDTVFFSNDSQSNKTQVVTIGLNAITIPLIPDLYLRTYFRDKVYNIPAFKIS